MNGIRINDSLFVERQSDGGVMLTQAENEKVIWRHFISPSDWVRLVSGLSAYSDNSYQEFKNYHLGGQNLLPGNDAPVELPKFIGGFDQAGEPGGPAEENGTAPTEGGGEPDTTQP